MRRRGGQGCGVDAADGQEKESIRLQTPKGIELNLKVLDIQMLADEARCAIRKDSGDDPDVDARHAHFCRGEKIR